MSRSGPRAAAAAGFPLLKIKLGSGDLTQDRAILAAVQEATSARLMVDANAAWSPQEAVQIGPDLVAAGVELLEQPVAASDLAGMAHVHAHVPLPLIADESCVVAEDVPRIASACDGINIKLMKCGGLRPARRLIEVARAHGLQVMVGCMVESSLAITAATHLLPCWIMPTLMATYSSPPIRSAAPPTNAAASPRLTVRDSASCRNSYNAAPALTPS